MSATKTRTQVAADLHARQDVDDDDIPAIIEIAQELQAEARERDDDVSVEEVEAIAEELGIDPSFVEEAIALKAERAEATAVASRAAEAKASRLRSRILKAVASVVLAVMVGTLGLGFVGAGAVRSAHDQVELAESALVTVLERQASLAPQLLALGGGDAAGLESATEALREAPDVEARLRASEALGVAMAEQLSALSGANDAVRTELHYELTGTQNRITTERRRLLDAQAEHEARAITIPGNVAVGL